MPKPIEKGPFRVCSRTGKIVGLRLKSCWLPVAGFLALVWFLIRVVPKPSRAAYPCQRAAFPLVSAFIGYLLALPVSLLAFRKGRQNLWRARYAVASLCFVIAAGAGLVSLSTTSKDSQAASTPNSPVGQAKGIFPGRVAWVYAPDAVNWSGYTSTEHWYQSNHTDLAKVETMMSKAVQSVGGGNSDAASWDAVFKHFNSNHGKGPVGYQPGEKVAIKLNLTTCNGRSGSGTVDIYGTYEKQDAYWDGHWRNTIDNSPQMLLSLLRQLVYNAGVNPTNIFIGDPTANFPKFLWDQLHPEFPGVRYFDYHGGQGRMRTELSTVPFNWSTADAAGKVQDYIPVPLAQADYLINFAVLKGHSVGVTVCGKNFYGALLRCPDTYFRDAYGPDQGGKLNYLNTHTSGPDPGQGGTPGTGRYRAIVDLMGHPALGDKTLLCLVDGLYGGYFWDSHPKKWNTAPFNTNWPSSLFASQDPVAIDSVCYDFLLNEWPNVVNNGKETPGDALQGGAEDYLHEAALADSPPSSTIYQPGGQRLSSLGVHEHWNNPTNKQYSRNLNPSGTGIELVAIQPGLNITVAITNPAAGAAFTPGTNITLQASVISTAAPVSKVEFYRNGMPVGVSTSEPYSVIWSNVPAGTWSLTALVTDTNNFSGISPAVDINVQTGYVPEILGITASNGLVAVTYSTVSGRTYHVETTTSFPPAGWTPISGSTTNASGNVIIFTDPNAGGDPQRFYRIGSP